MGVPESPGKPFDISKRDVWDAWVKVKTNQGAPGVDEQSIADFETDLKHNLYKVWNRMSSGSYFPALVRAVEILKPHGGGVRTLGIPTVGDRVAQTVVASIWKSGWNRSSTPIPTATARAARRWMRSRSAGSGAGRTTG